MLSAIRNSFTVLSVQICLRIWLQKNKAPPANASGVLRRSTPDALNAGRLLFVDFFIVPFELDLFHGVVFSRGNAEQRAEQGANDTGGLADCVSIWETPNRRKTDIRRCQSRKRTHPPHPSPGSSPAGFPAGATGHHKGQSAWWASFLISYK